jgi:energy-coupling factor transporter ATP-binding protein EcfA2
MIHKVRLENFKGHMDTTVSLGRLTMLVGSNGSGKTSVLEALSMQSMLGTSMDLTLQGERARTRLLRRSSDTLVVTSGGTRREGEGTKLPWSSRIELKRDDSASDGWSAQLDAEVMGQRFRIEQRFPGGERCGAIPVAEAPAWKALGDLFRPVHVFELDARSIAAGTFGGAQADRWLDERGTKTAGLLAHLQRDQNERFQRVEDGLRRLVPSVRRVRLQPALREGQEGCSIVFDLEGSSGAPAHEAGRERCWRSPSSRCFMALRDRTSSCSTDSITDCILTRSSCW